MATMKNNLTKAQFADKFRAAFPGWVVEISGNELIAMSPSTLPYEQVVRDIRKLTSLAEGTNVLVTAQSRQGRTILSADIRTIPS